MEGISQIYQRWIKPQLFRFDPETIHHRTLSGLVSIGKSPVLLDLVRELLSVPTLATKIGSIEFPNPIGLAAGMDKNAIAIPAWAAMGFGFCEVGGVTRYPQPGNPKPRLFRAPETEAIINRMGFNNLGADAIRKNLQASHATTGMPLAINLGKSKRTPLEDAAADFSYSLRKLWAVGDFFVVNVSSPNTPGLRTLQDKAALEPLIQALVETNAACAEQANVPTPKPVFIKIAPDMDYPALDDIVELVLHYQLAGIVATNTTTTRPDPPGIPRPTVYDQEIGGLSGKPLGLRSTEIIRYLAQNTAGKIKIIGVGGIDSPVTAWEKISSGAHLCQIYTGLVYQGPGLIRDLVVGIQKQLNRHGFNTLDEAIGSGCPYIEPGR